MSDGFYRVVDKLAEERDALRVRVKEVEGERDALRKELETARDRVNMYVDEGLLFRDERDQLLTECDQLLAQVAALRGALERLGLDLSYEDGMRRYAGRIASILESTTPAPPVFTVEQVAPVIRTLERYAEHAPYCDCTIYVAKPCNCGLTDACIKARQLGLLEDKR